MTGNHQVRTHQAGGARPLPHPHGELAAHRQDRHLRPVHLADELHVAEQTGVAGVVHGDAVVVGHDVAAHGPTGVVEHPLGQWARQHVVRQRVRVVRLRHGDLQVLDGDRATGIQVAHRVRWHPHLGRDLAQLVVADEGGPGSLADLVTVADVVGVAVGAEHDVRPLHLGTGQRGGGVVVEPRIEVAHAAARLETERCMAEKGNRQFCHCWRTSCSSDVVNRAERVAAGRRPGRGRTPAAVPAGGRTVPFPW